MAAGEGRRMRPITDRFAKPVLPIDGQPVVLSLLHELAAAGVSSVTAVTGHLAEQVERVLGGASLALEIEFVRQPQIDGSAGAVRCGLPGHALPCLVTAADTLYTPGDVRRFVEQFAVSGADGAMAYRLDPPPAPGKPPVKVVDGAIERIIDDDPSNPRSSAPLWVLGPPVAAFLEDLPGPPYELAEAFQRAIDSGITIAGIEIGRTRDLTYPLDLVRENFPYLGSL